MKNLKINSVLLILLISTVSTFSANAQRGDREEFRGQRAKMEEGKQRGPRIPNLTDEQKEKMKELRLDMQKKKLPIENQLREKKARMRTLSTAENADMKAINKLIEEIGALKIDMDKIKASHHQEIRKQLTEEQRLMFDAHAGERGGKRKRGHHGQDKFSGR